MKTEIKRNITEREEEAFRLVSGDFGGLTPEQAAKEMSVSEQRINTLLQNVKTKAPQLFPMITKSEANVLVRIKEGQDDEYILRAEGLTPAQLVRALRNLRAAGRIEQAAKIRVLQYEAHMDAEIERKF